MRIGSLFSGAAGLDMAVQQVFGGTVAWHCELDPAASKVLAHRYPGVPNHHDITTTDWSQVEPVDIMCGGWPCQPFSLAGKRKGAEDERALWPYVAGAVRMVRPRIIVLENVSAVLGPEFQRVANDLAALGYDIAWTCLRASDIGAPHRRERVFIVAHTEGIRWGVRDTTHHRQADREVHASTDNRGFVADSSCDGRHERRTQPAGFERGSDAPLSSDGPVELLPTPNAQDGNGGGRYSSDGHQSTLPGEVRLLTTPLARDGRQAAPGDYNRHTPSLAAVDHYLPTPTASDCTGGGQAPERRVGHTGQLIDEVLTTQWGKYASAIARWESVTRPAPAPTEPNTKGNPRLSAAFSEWMLGWPTGWVTDVPGITRNDQLRIIGNGVVPAQAAAALSWLLSLEVAA